MPKKILLTGVGGFIGSHCLEWWLMNTDWEIIGIDSFCHKGVWKRIDEVHNRLAAKVSDPARCQEHIQQLQKRVKLYIHDLSTPIDKILENQLLERKIQPCGKVVGERIHYIVNMASDSAVERSTSNPIHCLQNNYNLAINMLEFARIAKPDAFIQVSTDEVYGEAPPKPSIGHTEWSPIIPSNPYSASKAAQEAIAISYWRTFDVPVVLTNCMNVIGEWQDPEKMVPKVINYVMQGKSMPIYADYVGDEPVLGSRVYTDARCKADALQFILQKLIPSRYKGGAKVPDRYNIVGETELDNLDIARTVAKIMGKDLRYEMIPSESARPGYDRRYALDGTKLRNKGWVPPFTFPETIERIVKWTMKHPHWLV
jgi:dTDP-glucose 4,6-dehydratase